MEKLPEKESKADEQPGSILRSDGRQAGVDDALLVAREFVKQAWAMRQAVIVAFNETGVHDGDVDNLLYCDLQAFGVIMNRLPASLTRDLIEAGITSVRMITWGIRPAYYRPTGSSIKPVGSKPEEV